MSLTTSAPQLLAALPQQLTVGVEEEFLLLDPDTMHNAPLADDARAALAAEAQQASQVEFRRSMMEMVTPVSSTLQELKAHLLGNRIAAAAAASAVGTRLVAIAATPIAERDRSVVDKPRFHEISRHYGPIAHDPALCGVHVHVGVPDPELAVQVCNHIRPWLPVVQALTANSPWHAGTDSQHASWRSIQLERWPSLGPSPYLRNLADYERAVRELVATGVMLDPTMVLWWARPSMRYPTVEVRVGDVCPTADDTVLVAGLVRALVATVLEDIVTGRPVPRPPWQILRAAHWNAAHAGLGGTLLDLRNRQARPAWELVGELYTKVEAALDRHGDRELVSAGLARVKAQGNGAVWQRRVQERTGDLRATLHELADRTTQEHVSD